MSETDAPTPRLAALIAGATVAALVAYAGLSYWLMVHAAREPWAVAVLFGPLILAIAGTALQRRQFGLLAACAAGTLGLALVIARGGVDDANRMYVLQHAGIHGALAWTFGRTLRAGATPLISTMALTVHGKLTDEVRDYTRWLTGLWTVYFVGMIGASVLIYALAPWPWWSLFDSTLTPAALITIFVVEHVQRYRRHPNFERVSLRRAIAAYRQSGQPEPMVQPVHEAPRMPSTKGEG